jgi:predicted metalloprotease
MDLEGRRESENVEDRRGLTPGQMAVGGGIGAVIIGLVAYFLGADPQQLANLFPGGGQQQNQPAANPAEDKVTHFVKKVLGTTEDVWEDQFQKMGRQYRKPKLVLFRGRVESACGLADSAVGPFYCPGDEQVYLDLSFFEELKNRFKAPGEFA